MKLICYIK